MSATPVIFLAFANDREDYLHQLTEEQNAIRQALKSMQREGLCEVVYETDTDLQKIWSTFDEYQDRIAIFHYAGHAEDYSLLLHKPNGEQQLVDGEGLVAFLGRQRGLQLAFLNGCSSKRQAEEIRDRGVPAVIGTAEPIDDRAATELSKTFYEGLAAGRSIEQAWLGAKDRIRSDKRKKEEGFHRGIKLKDASGQYTREFPWELYIRPGAEIVKDWNLPRAARNPLFGLPLPEEAFLRLPSAPFVGLHYFREEDAAIFHGRGAQIRALYNHLQGVHPIILVFGKSGVGKSSMLDAGLLPRIKNQYEITYARRLQDKGLLGTLDLALDEVLGTQAAGGNDPENFAQKQEAWEYLRRAADAIPSRRLRKEVEDLIRKLVQDGTHHGTELTGILKKWQVVEVQQQKPLVIILDQVEEKYTRPMPGSNSAENDELLEFLMAILPLFREQNSGIQGKLILSYRKEYHPEIRDTFRSLSLPYAELFLKRLDREGIIEAVRSTTLHDQMDNGIIRHNPKYNPYRLELERSAQGFLPEIIADDLMEDPESPIAPVLQIILDKLWQTAPKTEGQPVRLTIQQYQELRKQGTTMGEFFLEQMEKLAKDHPQAVNSGLALDLLHAHTTRMGTAGSCRREELFQLYTLDKAPLAKLIQALEDLSLLVRIDTRQASNSEGGDSYTTQLSHDTLAPVVIREYNVSDAPGQRAARILNNKLTDIGFQLPAAYLDSLRLAGVPDEDILELAKEIIGWDRFQTELRNRLGEEHYLRQRNTIVEKVLINLHPGRQEVYLEESDLAIVKNVTGQMEGDYPGMRRLSRAEALLVEDSIQRRTERERQEQERLQRERESEEKEKRLLAEKLATERRAARRQRVFSGMIGVAFLVAVGLAIFSYYQMQKADKQSREIQSAALAGQALRLFQDDNTLGLNLAIAAYKRSPENSESIHALNEILKDQNRRFYSHKISFPVAIRHVKFSNDGNYLLVGGEGRLYIAETEKKEFKKLALELVSNHMIMESFFFPDNKTLSICAVDDNYKYSTYIYDLIRDSLLQKIDGYPRVISPNGKFFCIENNDLFYKWDRDENKTTFLIEGIKDSINNFAFSNDEEYIITYSPGTAGQNEYTSVWDLKGTRIDSFENFRFLKILPDNQTIIGLDSSDRLGRWQIGEINAVFYEDIDSDAYENKYSYEYEHSADYDYDYEEESDYDHSEIYDYEGPEVFRREYLTYLVLNNTFEDLKSLYNPYESYYDFQISQDSRFVYFVDSQKIVCRFDVGTGEVEYLTANVIPSNVSLRKISNVAFSLEKTIAAVPSEKTLYTFPLSLGNISKFTDHGVTPTCILFSNDGKKVFTGNEDGTIKIWNADGENELIQSSKVHFGRIKRIAVSPDGQFLLSATAGGTIKLSTAKGEILHTFYDENLLLDENFNLQFSPNGKTFLIATLYKEINVWNLDGELLFQRPNSHYSFSSDGIYILVNDSMEKGFELINLDSGARENFFPCDTCEKAQLSPDNKTVIIYKKWRSGYDTSINGYDTLEIRDMNNKRIQSLEGWFWSDRAWDNNKKYLVLKDSNEIGQMWEYSLDSSKFSLIVDTMDLNKYLASNADLTFIEKEDFYVFTAMSKDDKIKNLHDQKNGYKYLEFSSPNFNQRFSLGQIKVPMIRRFLERWNHQKGISPEEKFIYSQTDDKAYIYAEFFWEWESGLLWDRVYRLSNEEREKYGITWDY